MTFWNNVKQELSYKNLTQKELANITGLNYRTLQNWITRNILPNVEDGYKIAAALNTSVEFLVTGKENNSAELQLTSLKAKLTEILLEKK